MQVATNVRTTHNTLDCRDDAKRLAKRIKRVVSRKGGGLVVCPLNKRHLRSIMAETVAFEEEYVLY